MRKFIALIVDDDADIRDLHESLCQVAIAEVKKESEIQFDSQIITAPELNKAIDLFAHNDVSFVSLDLALTKNEEELSGKEKQLGAEISGIVFLNVIDASDVNIIIVSGEKIDIYAEMAMKNYGVLAFYEKSKYGEKEYRNAVKCFVYYHCARDLIFSRTSASVVTKKEADLVKKLIHRGMTLGSIAHVNCDKLVTLELKATELHSAPK